MQYRYFYRIPFTIAALVAVLAVFYFNGASYKVAAEVQVPEASKEAPQLSDLQEQMRDYTRKCFRGGKPCIAIRLVIGADRMGQLQDLRNDNAKQLTSSTGLNPARSSYSELDREAQDKVDSEVFPSVGREVYGLYAAMFEDWAEEVRVFPFVSPEEEHSTAAFMVDGKFLTKYDGDPGYKISNARAEHQIPAVRTWIRRHAAHLDEVKRRKSEGNAEPWIGGDEYPRWAEMIELAGRYADDCFFETRSCVGIIFIIGSDRLKGFAEQRRLRTIEAVKKAGVNPDSVFYADLSPELQDKIDESAFRALGPDIYVTMQKTFEKNAVSSRIFTTVWPEMPNSQIVFLVDGHRLSDMDRGGYWISDGQAFDRIECVLELVTAWAIELNARTHRPKESTNNAHRIVKRCS